MSKAGVAKDIVILDPPAFVKSSSKTAGSQARLQGDQPAGAEDDPAGRFPDQLFLLAFPGERRFHRRVIMDAAHDAGRRIKLIEFKTQPYDHAVLLPLFQSDYLKCALFYVY